MRIRKELQYILREKNRANNIILILFFNRKKKYFLLKEEICVFSQFLKYLCTFAGEQIIFLLLRIYFTFLFLINFSNQRNEKKKIHHQPLIALWHAARQTQKSLYVYVFFFLFKGICIYVNIIKKQKTYSKSYTLYYNFSILCVLIIMKKIGEYWK